MRLIDADALWVKLLQVSTEEELQSKDEVVEGIDKALHYVSMAPTIEAKPVVHAHWFLLDDCANEGVYCSACRKKAYRIDYANPKVKAKYCPNCGAQMDESISCSHENDKHIAEDGKKGVKIPVISMEDVPKVMEEMEK